MKKVYNAELSTNDLGKEVTLYGWVARIRKLGKIVFINLRDSSGLIQLIVRDTTLITNLNKESVIKVKGQVLKRKSPNLKLKTGEIEVAISELEVLSNAQELPFEIETLNFAHEDLRLKHRYLNLRVPKILNNLKVRHQLFQLIRTHLTNKKFIEIETPFLSRSTPEGAKDFLVPTTFDPTEPTFFALPQSPQLYKQLLMIGGVERYFQITKAFRDENTRADRQPEFTQLDIEISFINEEGIKTLIEALLKDVLVQMGYQVNLPFLKMNYDDALNNYGTDKPNVNFEYKLIDTTNQIKLEKNLIMKTLFFDLSINKKTLDHLKEIATKNGDGQLHYFSKTGNNSSINQIFQNKKGFYIIGDFKTVTQGLGAVRNELNKIFQLVKTNNLSFVWIEKWPLFKYSFSDKKYTSMHHPFTAPTTEYLNNFEQHLSDSQARAYDLVLNGHEIAGGSVRINNLQIQQKMFKVLGLTNQEIEQKFGFFLEAFKYGVPPHAGIAFGLDRLIMVLQNEVSIREVIAFPKNAQSFDPLTLAPTKIAPAKLKDYHLIKLKKI